jgi:hypothetical protein
VLRVNQRFTNAISFLPLNLHEYAPSIFAAIPGYTRTTIDTHDQYCTNARRRFQIRQKMYT